LVFTPPLSVLYKTCLLLLRFGSKVSYLVSRLPSFQSKCFTLFYVQRSAVSRLRSLSSSQRHRLAFLSRSKSRTHHLDGDIRLYSLSTTASSSDTRSTRVWLEDTHVTLRRPCSAQASNERITFVSALDPRNKRGYDVLLFRPPASTGQKARAVTLYDDCWHELDHDTRTRKPYLGVARPDIHEFDGESLPSDHEPTIKDSDPKTQTKNPSYQGQHHQNQAEVKHQPAHSLLTRISAGLPHHQTKTPPPSPDIDDLHHQTNIALASLLLSRNNNHPQQIWRLRLLRLQQQQLLSDLTHHQQTLPRRQTQVTLDLNKSPVIYTTPCAGTHLPLEDLEGLTDLADLADLVDLEDLVDLVDPEDQERLKDPLQQYLWQSQEETQTTGLWETFPKYSMETARTLEPSLTPYSATSEQTQESPALIHPCARYPSHSRSSREPK
jgi:hypothetical protein